MNRDRTRIVCPTVQRLGCCAQELFVNPMLLSLPLPSHLMSSPITHVLDPTSAAQFHAYSAWTRLAQPGLQA